MLEASLRFAQRIRADDEVLVGVERSAGPDHVIELVMVQSEAVLEQDGVVLGGVQFAVSDIGHLQVLEDTATFQLEFPKLRDLVRRLIRPVGKCSRGIRQHEGNKYTANSQHGLHRSFPLCSTAQSRSRQTESRECHGKLQEGAARFASMRPNQRQADQEAGAYLCHYHWRPR